MSPEVKAEQIRLRRVRNLDREMRRQTELDRMLSRKTLVPMYQDIGPGQARYLGHYPVKATSATR